MRRLISVMVGFAACIAGHASAQEITPQRIVSLGGGITEIIFALGQQHRLAGVDQSSLYPKQAQLLPSVGYYRSIPVEGILQLKPDMVIASEQAGPAHSMSQLSELGLRVERVSDQPEVDSLYIRIEQVAKLLGVPERGKLIRDALEHEIAHAYQFSADQPTVMMVVMRSGKLLGAGSKTAAAKIIELSSLDNVLKDIQGYRQISAEVVSTRMPSALIVTTSSVQSLGGISAVREHPALRHIPAVENGRLIELEDLLAQGLGLRLPLAIQTIRQGVSQ